MDPDVSVVLPAHNEVESLPGIVAEVIECLTPTPLKFEVLIVDDGSSDGTRSVATRLAADIECVRAVRIRRNVGKSAALQVGLREAAGDRIVMMDADGQDDPAAIPMLLASLDGGLDLVTGRRADRKDRVVKRSTSRLYNAMTARVTGVEGRDFNSGLKAMTRDVADSLELYGELHRYIPVLASWSGFRVGEIDVNHRPRLHGETKFRTARFWRGFFDLVTVKFLTTYNARPFHLFGGVGFSLAAVGSGILGWLLYTQISGHGISARPALFAGVLLVLVGVQLLCVGLLAELIVHFRNTAQNPSQYAQEL
ncbi:MAG: glycosyltransferase family 2 protein [Actinobacteria bacterium]|nr:glycosyltransferase family 2 protein [Actinomycetota bacterium]